MESIDNLWQKFSLNDKEECEYDLEQCEEEAGFFLAAKFITRRVVNVEAVARTFKPLWRADKGFSVKAMGDNTLLFNFNAESDLERVLANEPWTYDKYVILFKRVEEDAAVENIMFSSVPIWVQLHGLPIRCLSREVAMDMGSLIGQVIPYTSVEEERSGENKPRIKVRLDITQPLCRGRRVKLGKDRSGWIAFKYERLPNFCYQCGLLTHGDKDCSETSKRPYAGSSDQAQFGPWLRADLENSHWKSWVTVEGRRNPFQRPPQPDKDSQAPPAARKSMRKPAGTEESDMETEENQEFDLVDPRLPSMNAKDFDENLREIDRALNFGHNACMDNISVINGEPTNENSPHQPHNPTNPGPAQPNLTIIHNPPIEPTRIPFRDILNTSPPPKPTQAQPVWKRIPRQQHTILSPEITLPAKRAVSPIAVTEEARRKRHEVFCVEDGNTFISAAAGHQPRRSQ
jgi:hypothetical protein